MIQLSQEEARRIFDSGVWEHWNDEEKAFLQSSQPFLMMPFPVFNAAIDYVMGEHIGLAAISAMGQKGTFNVISSKLIALHGEEKVQKYFIKLLN